MKKALGCFGWLIVISVVISMVTSLLVIAAPLALVVSIFAWWHFNKKGNEKYVTVAKLSTVISALGAVFFIYAINSPTEPETATAPVEQSSSIEQVDKQPEETTEEVAEQTEETEEDVSEEEAEKEKLREDEEEALRLEAINHDIDEWLDENKSFALGTHESSTEANPSFAYSLYIMSLEYDGSALKMQADAGFIDLSDEDKTSVANSAQNVANVVIGSHEDWESEDYTQRKFLSVFNGKNVLGQSKILDRQEFSWN